MLHAVDDDSLERSFPAPEKADPGKLPNEAEAYVRGHLPATGPYPQASTGISVNVGTISSRVAVGNRTCTASKTTSGEALRIVPSFRNTSETHVTLR